jgi:hypothetical protein
MGPCSWRGISRTRKSMRKRLKEMSKSNFQTRNKTRSCDSKIKTYKITIKT